MISIVAAGWNSTLQQRHGRPGLAHLGVTRAGAVDPPLAALLNRMVGNDADATLIETTGGLVVRADAAVVVASSAESVPTVLRAGQSFTVPIGGRVWQYLAVRGGIVAESVLGSTSRDTLAQLGPGPLQVGDQLQIGAEPGQPPAHEIVPLREPATTLRVVAGPRADWFRPDWRELVSATEWTVTNNSRIGVRMRGRVIDRVVIDELPSEGLVRGAIQVPPGGEMVVMSADHPTTGGYPVVAVVHRDDLATSAQHAPGTRLRLRVVENPSVQLLG